MAEIFNLLVAPDADLWASIGLTLLYATAATLVALIPAMWLAYLLAGDPMAPRQGLRRLGRDVIHATIALPALAIGVSLYLILSEAGPLGFLHATFSPVGLLIVQIVLALPLVTALFVHVFEQVPPKFAELAVSCGATPSQVRVSLIRQSLPALVSAAGIGWARVIGEVGAAAIVGGNLAGTTRLVPTAMALEIQHGEFRRAVGLGLVLLMMAFFGAVTFRLMQRS
ncbi:MAG: ABC transporter permease [Candidatus Sericytochromatia bacterium]|nr:ABC transporter permease [Candidatus Sericytochromatia bacterium]